MSELAFLFSVNYLISIFLLQKEENDVGEFFLTLEKDPQQEDFLQGRMQGNPYRSVVKSWKLAIFRVNTQEK